MFTPFNIDQNIEKFQIKRHNLQHEGLSPSHYHVCDCVLEWVSNIHLYLVKQ